VTATAQAPLATVPVQQQPQPAGVSGDDVLAIAAAGVLVTAVTASAAASALQSVFRPAGVPAPALRTALHVVMSFPPDQLGAMGPATMQVMRMNQIRRAQFVVASARRVTRALADGRARNVKMSDTLSRVLTSERRYYGQQLQAGWSRMSAASRTDSAASLYGTVLGWAARMDSHTSAECRAADGRNYRADTMPLIGYPGMVHPHCRCFPARPFRSAKMLP
jgi:hypothetical protein